MRDGWSRAYRLTRLVASLNEVASSDVMALFERSLSIKVKQQGKVSNGLKKEKKKQ